MSEVKQPAATQPADVKERLLDIFTRLLPLVDSVSDKIRFAALLGVGLDVWIFIWLYFLKHFSLSSALIVAGVALLPILILLRFWWALEELKDLPNIAGRMVDDAKGEIRETVQGIQAGNTPKLGFISSAKSLWSIGSMASEARELLGSYLSIGTLVNPFSLVLGVLSLLFVLLLAVIGLVLLALALF
ncbi:hypothetical protein VSS37_21375 [Candidatus Thiothrix sp. Deng01]|uniref:AI-2E family transporter n=1 Tax=Candidatus Thiothrix phosphatis TaxID=3112415 RepID=A0ABU6D4E7_9GAMM|nr:hypothetical protein [Candidatus Thiothrix sp. Deng01]MEB4593543.1 hypothetical protein [Candidatus Thiothrix sp. Deng01]